MILLGGPVFIDTKQGRIPSNSINIDAYDPEMIAKAHADLGYKAALAPYIPIENTTLLRKTESAFKKQGVVLAELGYWENLLDRNEDTKHTNINKMCEILASADEMGVICAVNTIGAYTYGTVNDNFNAKSLSEEMFDMAVENCRYILKQVNPKRTKLTFENFAFTALDSIDMIEKLIKAVDDSRLGVHLDASNLVTSVREYFSFNDIVKESFKRFGDLIVSTHIKDLKLTNNVMHVEMREVIPGTGDLDITYYLKNISSLSKGIPCIFEHLHLESEYDTSRAAVQQICKENGFVL